MEKAKLLKTLQDYGPLIGFFIIYQIDGLKNATLFLVVSTLILSLFSFIFYREISWISVFAAFFVGLFGGLTLWLDDPIFIMIKPTILNICFSFILLVSIWLKKNLLKTLFQGSIQISDPAWKILTYRYAILFLCLAGLNEWAWRIMGESFWVSFKLFGLTGIILIFTVIQGKFILNNQVDK